MTLAHFIDQRPLRERALEARQQRERDRARAEREQAQQHFHSRCAWLRTRLVKILGLPTDRYGCLVSPLLFAPTRYFDQDGIHTTIDGLTFGVLTPDQHSDRWRVHLVQRCERCGQDSWSMVCSLADVGEALESAICGVCQIALDEGVA